MKLNKEKVDIMMARNCMEKRELAKKCGFTPARLYQLMRCENALPKSVGKVAQALGCDVTEIIDSEN